MLKICYKIKKELNKKGFTLVELLAVIVILAIIMLIAIPAILDTMNTVKKKSFNEYVDKILLTSQKQVVEESVLDDSINGCKVYYIKKDLGLASTGNYDGYVFYIDKIKSSDSDDILDGYLVILWDEDYAAIKVVDADGKIIEDRFMKYTEFIEYIKSLGFDEPDIHFMNYYSNRVSFDGCIIDDEIPNSEEDTTPYEDREAIITNGKHAHEVLSKLTGCDLTDISCKKNLEFKKYDGSSPVLNNNYIITTSESRYPVYAWNDGNVIYYYSTAAKVYLKNGIDMFKNLPFNNIDLSGMLFNRTETTNSMFADCSKLEKVTFGLGDMSKNLDTDYMFKDCSVLKVIYVLEDWNIKQNIHYYSYFGEIISDYYEKGMFTNCTQLCGAVKFDRDFNDKYYANIHGYLTLVGDYNPICDPSYEYEITH